MKRISIILSFVFCLLSFGTSFAYTSTDVSNAEQLVVDWIIKKQHSTNDYRLDDKITRAEVMGIALKMKWIVLLNYQCKWYYTDVKNNDWICRAVELATDNGMISRANTKARPQDSITRAEALALLWWANNLDIFLNAYWELWLEWPLKFDNANKWQSRIILKALLLDIINPPRWTEPLPDPWMMSEYVHIQFFPNNFATRAEIFDFAWNILDFSNKDGDWDIGDLINLQETEYRIDTDEQWKSISFWPIVEHPWHGTPPPYPKDYQCNMAKISWTDNYTSYDTTPPGSVLIKLQELQTPINYLMIKSRTGYVWLSSVGDPQTCLEYIRDYHGHIISFNELEVIRAYYQNILWFIEEAYKMRSPTGVSLETFQSWYKNVTSVVFREDTLQDLGNNTYEFLVDMTESGIKSTYKVKSKVDLENFKIDNISSVKQ